MERKRFNLIKIGKRIRKMREAEGFSQEDFAAHTDLGRAYYGRVERGEQNISILNLLRIAFVLKVEVGELIPSLKELKKLSKNEPL